MPSGASPAESDPLVHFHEALRDLRAHARRDHVRVLFFGDSHTQGEVWPNAVRRALQTAFGDGGPGFVYAGLSAHRDDAAKTTLEGTWEQRPSAPSSGIREGDGKWGLGGAVARAEHGTARATVSPRTPAAMRWDVCLRRREGSANASLSAGGAPTLVRDLAPGEFGHRSFESPAPGSISIDVEGDVDLCGVVGERQVGESPGVVLDSLGINGARYATALAWDEPTFASELARRKPDLVVLEYGTNESAEKELRPQAYAREARELVDRIRRAVPDVSCVLVGPTEIEAHPEGAPLVGTAIEGVATDEGCAFWDTYRVMGGPGTMHAWRTADPPLAQIDGIHLTAAGYEKLGAELARDLLADLQ